MSNYVFTATTMTVAEKTFSVRYSKAKNDNSLWIFTNIDLDGNAVPVRLHVFEDMTMYADVLSAYELAKSGETIPEESKPEPEAAETIPEPKPETEAAEIVPEADPEPEELHDIVGKGYKIIFDKNIDRVRVVLNENPSLAQKVAVETAKFFYSNKTKSYHKRMNERGINAAMKLANILNAL